MNAIINETPSTSLIFKVWWSLFWRVCLWLILFNVLNFIFLVVLGVGMRLSGIGQETVDSIFPYLGGFIGFIIGVLAFFKGFKAVLGKEFEGSKLCLLKVGEQNKI